MKLYEITNEFQSIWDQLGDEGEISPELMEELDGLNDKFEAKAIAVASHIKNLEAEEDAITNAIKEMNKRKSRLIKQTESLTAYLHSNLTTLGIDEIKSCPYFKIRFKKCPPSVVITDELLVPGEYWKETVMTMIDKLKIKEDLKEGLEISGVHLQTRIKLEIK